MFTFRQKLFITYLAVFFLFLALVPLFSSSIVQRVVKQGMENRAQEIINKIQNLPNDEMLIRKLKELQPDTFFRISLINPDRKVLFDSHTRRLLGPKFSQEHVVTHREVLQAFAEKKGYTEEYSKTLSQKFAYTAIAFDFHGKTYVLRTAFPYRYVQELIHDFEIGFAVLATLILILFTCITWFAISRLSKPIQEIISSVTHYKEFEPNPLTTLKRIAAKNEGGEDIGNLAKTLLNLSQRVQTQIAALKDFIANASHELKTPITIVRGFAETLHEHPELSREATLSITEKIVKNCERMAGLVRDLLALANIESSPNYKREPFNLISLMQNIIQTVQSMHPEAIIHLQTHNETTILLEANSNLLEMAFSNLISNAVKYSHPPAQVNVDITCKENNVVVQVIDQGIGIPEEALPRIFERFYRVSPKAEGSGLGLSIVQTIIHKHSGTVTVASQVGAGSCFTVTLPRKSKQD